jgi:hypothetical protein
MDRGDSTGAEPLLREVIGWHESSGSPAWQYAGELRRLGTIAAGRGSYAEAETLLVRSLEARSAQWGERHELTLESMRELAAFYDAWGKSEKARGYRARALAAGAGQGAAPNPMPRGR